MPGRYAKTVGDNMADIDGPRYVVISPVKSKSYVKMFHSTLTFPLSLFKVVLK